MRDEPLATATWICSSHTEPLDHGDTVGAPACFVRFEEEQSGARGNRVRARCATPGKSPAQAAAVDRPLLARNPGRLSTFPARGDAAQEALRAAASRIALNELDSTLSILKAALTSGNSDLNPGLTDLRSALLEEADLCPLCVAAQRFSSLWRYQTSRAIPAVSRTSPPHEGRPAESS